MNLLICILEGCAGAVATHFALKAAVALSNRSVENEYARLKKEGGYE